MHSLLLRKSHYGIMLIFSICAVVCALHWLGIFHSTDHLVSDTFQNWHRPERSQSNVLLVYTPREILKSDSDDLDSLLTAIDQFGATKIGVLTNAPFSNELALRLADHPASDKLFLGVERRHQNRDLDATHIKTGLVKTGLVDLNLYDQPVYREHYSELNYDDEQSAPTAALEVVLANSLLPTSQTLPSKFGIRFAGSLNSLPHIQASEILGGQAIAEMAKGKVVLIGPPSEIYSGFCTPTTHGSQRMQRLELHGHILETLLTGTYLTTCGIALSGVLVLLISLIAWQTIRQISVRGIPLALAFGIAACGFASWACFCYASFQLPTTAMLLCTLLSSCTAIYLRLVVSREAAKVWQAHTSPHLQLAEPESPWDLIQLSALQMFCPKQMALLELGRRQTHVEVVKTFNCELDQIVDPRRDISRAPMRTAIEKGQPVIIENQNFFESTRQEEQLEFIAPLNYESRTLGFIVVVMDRSELKSWEDFHGFFDRFASEMSVLLGDQLHRKRKSRTNSSLSHKLKYLPEQHTLRRVFDSQKYLTTQQQRIEYVIDESQSAIAICDPFGRIIRVNPRMTQTLKELDVQANETNCAELISRVSQRNIHECRVAVRTTIDSGSESQFYVPPNNERNYPLIVHVKPLLTTPDQANERFEYPHVTIEIIDGRVFTAINNWQNHFQDTTSFDTAITTAIEQLAIVEQHANQDSAELDGLISSLNETISEVKTTLTHPRTAKDQQVTEDPHATLQVDTREIFDMVLTEQKPKFDEQEINCEIEFKDPQPTGVANPFLLQKVFKAIFDLLTLNAISASEILVLAESTEQRVRYTFRNLGNNSSLDALRKSLQSSDTNENIVSNDGSDLPAPQRDQFNIIQQWLETWSGSLRIATRADYGLIIELELLQHQTAGLENEKGGRDV